MMMNILVIVVTGILIAGLFVYLSRQKKQKLALLTNAVQAAGWQIKTIEERLVSGILVSGQAMQGEWFLETKATAGPNDAGPGSSETSLSTRWWTSAITLPEGNLLIGPRPPGSQLMGTVNGALLQIAFKVLLGKDADWVNNLLPIELAESAANQRFLCLGNSKEDVHRLMKPDAIQLLLHLPEKIQPVIKLRARGLEIALPGMRLEKIEDIQTLVNLGLNLIDSWCDNQAS